MLERRRPPILLPTADGTAMRPADDGTLFAGLTSPEGRRALTAAALLLKLPVRCLAPRGSSGWKPRFTTEDTFGEG